MANVRQERLSRVFVKVTHMLTGRVTGDGGPKLLRDRIDCTRSLTEAASPVAPDKGHHIYHSNAFRGPNLLIEKMIGLERKGKERK